MTTATSQPVTYGLDSSVARFSVDRYNRMIEAGILTPEDKVELLETYVVLAMPRNPPHESTVQRMLRPLLRHLPATWDLRIQSSISLDDSQPEPDFAIVRGSAADYETRHPGPADIGVLVEVASSSLVRDQRDKARIYARAGVVEYWIVNLVDRRIEVHTQPSGATAHPGYASVRDYHPGESLTLVLDGVACGTIAVAELLG